MQGVVQQVNGVFCVTFETSVQGRSHVVYNGGIFIKCTIKVLQADYKVDA